jgi:protein SCO1
VRIATTTCILLLLAIPASGQIVPRSAAEKVGIDQRIGRQIPLDLSFVDERGEQVRIGDLIGDKPVVLTPVYYSCPMLCNLVLDGLVKVARELRLDIGDDYDVISVSFDPKETSEMAEAKKKIYTRRYGRATVDQGWHFLTGEQLEIRQLMDSIGFRFAYDETLDEYAHAAVVIVLTPDGKIARYFYGFEYQPRDLRLALVEASKGRIGTAVDQVLLLCYSYDPHSGKYTAQVMNIIRIMGTATAAGLAGFIFIMVRRERKHRG